jgi:hypothetical protein
MSSFDELASLDLRALAEELASCRPATGELEPAQWLGIVELLTGCLVSDFETGPPELWSMYSGAFTYAIEAAMTSGIIDRRETVIRRLHLAASLLQKVPTSSEVELLDPARLIDLLVEELPMSADEARALSTDWRALDISDIRRLRAVKNLLSPALKISGTMCFLLSHERVSRSRQAMGDVR